MTIIVLEGADGTGKTSLAKKLEDYGYTYVRGSSFEIASKGVEEMYKHMNNILNMKNVVVDRFYLSNYVYGKLYNKNTMTKIMMNELRKKLNESGILVYLEADLKTVSERVKTRGDKDIQVEELNKIKNKYKKALNKEYLKPNITLSFNTTNMNVNLIASAVNSIADHQDTKTILFIEKDSK